MNTITQADKEAIKAISQSSKKTGININGGKVRRTSSRLCLGVEHGDYNGTELFGVGTDRFIWFAYTPNNTNRIRLFSTNYPDDGIVEFDVGHGKDPNSYLNSWARLPLGLDLVLRTSEIKLSTGLRLSHEPIELKTGIDGIVYGNIPGGGMSRSGSLLVNLALSILDANGRNDIYERNPFLIVDMAQAAEHTFGSRCGQLDQIMILFAKEGMGTYYKPKTKEIEYIPFGRELDSFRFVIMDTGKERPGLEKSTYKVRREECKKLVSILKEKGYGISCLADVKDEGMFQKIYKEQLGEPCLRNRLHYIYHAQKRFYDMIKALKEGDIYRVGDVFRKDGISLRDQYEISGPELQTMCDIARSVNGVLGERMLGGGDAGASGAIVLKQAVEALKNKIHQEYPKRQPDYADKYAVHECNVVSGVNVFRLPA